MVETSEVAQTRSAQKRKTAIEKRYTQAIMKVKIKAELDDEAFRTGEFIQELGKIQEEYLDKLMAKVEKEKWIEGMTKVEIHDWLFDYCFNGWEKDKNGFDLGFAESLDKCSKYEVE